MVIKKEVIKREIAGDTILVPVGAAVYDSNGLYALNELGAFIWDMLPDVSGAEEICERVVAEYDVSPKEAMDDINEFLDTLGKLGII
ncbi:MAG: PqqD family protein [Oscillospiraceae bacterium]|nr:PqqD family protein [Oscillospiraceae bacterium]